MDMRRLAGRAAVVTGGNSGIGFAIARRFLDEGAAVTIIGRSAGKGERARRALEEAVPGTRVRFAVADVRDREALRHALDDTEHEHGTPTILACAAGVGVVQLVSRTDLADWEWVMGTNVTGTLLAAQLLMPRMAAAGGGAIVTIGSDAGINGERLIGAYSVSKAAVVMLTKLLALDGAPDGIRANCICPTYVEPGMSDFPDRISGHDAGDVPEIAPLPPLGRYGRPEDVAALAAFLASDDAQFVSGATVALDGAMTAGIPAYDAEEVAQAQRIARRQPR